MDEDVRKVLYQKSRATSSGQKSAEDFPIHHMYTGKGYEIHDVRDTLEVKQANAHNELIKSIEDRLSVLNVFLFFQNIFQANVRHTRPGKADKLEKVYVRTNPMDKTTWGRQQSKLPMSEPEKYVNHVLVKNHKWTLVDLALDGTFWEGHEDLQLMARSDFQEALLDAIARNKADANDCSKWT